MSAFYTIRASIHYNVGIISLLVAGVSAFGVLLLFTLLYVALVSRGEQDAAPEAEKEA